MTDAKIQADLLKSTKGALAAFEKRVGGDKEKARQALIRLGTHTRNGDLAAPYK